MTPYTRHQLLVLLVVLLTAGLGLAVGHWRRAHPSLVERVEQLERLAAPDAPESPTAQRRAVGALPRAAPSGVAPRQRSQATKAEPAPVDLNHAGAAELVGLPGVGPALAARIKAYELAFRMQTSVPETLNLNVETQEMQQLYGLDDPATREFGMQMLAVRRFVERVAAYTGLLTHLRS